MARKSRKNVILQENTALPDKEKKVLFKAGLYARLSHEKEENIERGTIETQVQVFEDGRISVNLVYDDCLEELLQVKNKREGDLYE